MAENEPVPTGANPTTEDSADAALDTELVALQREVARLRAENARLLRLLELTPREARPPGPAQTAVFDAPPGTVSADSSPTSYAPAPPCQ